MTSSKGVDRAVFKRDLQVLDHIADIDLDALTVTGLMNRVIAVIGINILPLIR